MNHGIPTAKSRKGISPIVAVVLLIAIAVVAAVGLYFWAGGITARQPTPSVPIAITATPIDPANGKIAVANLGSTPLTVSRLNTADGTTCEFGETVTIQPGNQAVCTMPPKRGTTIIYGSNTSQAVVILPPQEVDNFTITSSAPFTESTWANPFSGTFTNTSKGSVELKWRSFWPTVVSSGDAGYPDIAANGTVEHIVWSDDNNIYYANSSSGWDKSTIYSCPEQLDDRVRIVADENGIVHMAWAEGPSYYDKVYYANSSSGWSPQLVSNVSGAEVNTNLDLAVRNGVAHIVWLDNRTGGGLDYYANSSSGWESENISSYVGDYPRIAVDSNNVSHITWIDFSTPNSVHYANSSSGWHDNTIASNSNFPAIAVGPSDDVHISWRYAHGGNHIMHASSTNGWSPETVYTYSTGNCESAISGMQGDIAVSANGNVHIIRTREHYRHCDTEPSLLYAKYNGTWHTSYIDADTRNGAYWPMITTDENNLAHISWGGNGKVYYANATGHYYAAGGFASSALNTNGITHYKNVTWTQTLPAGTSLSLKLRLSNDSSFSGYVDEPPTNNSGLGNYSKYIKLIANLSTDDVDLTPVLKSLVVTYKPALVNLTYAVNLDSGISWVALNRSDGSTLVNDTGLGCTTFHSRTQEVNTSYSYRVVAGDCGGGTYYQDYP